MREGSQRLHHLVAVSCLRRKPGAPTILFCLGQICPAKAPSTIRALFAVMSRTLGEVRATGGKKSEREGRLDWTQAANHWRDVTVIVMR